MKQLNISLFDIFFIILILLASFAIFGIQPFEGNNVLYLPYMEKIQNPSLFANDILFDAFKYHLTLFFDLVVVASNFFHISIKYIFILLCWLTSFLLALASFAIAQLLFKNKKISYLFLFFLMSAKYSLAYEAIGINLTQATQTTITIAIALIVFILFLKNKYYLTFFILGLVANFQPIITFQLVLVLTFSQIFKKRNKFANIVNLKNIIMKQYFFTFLGSLPIIIWAFILKNKSVLSSNWFSYAPEWFDIVKLRIAHHFLPSKWGLTCWFMGFLFFCLFISAILLKKNKSKLSDQDYTIISIMWGFVPVFFLGLIGEIIPIPLILLVEIFRVYVFFDFFCILYGSYLVYQLIIDSSVSKKILGLLIGYLLFLPTSVFFNINISKPVFIGPMIILLIFIIITLLNPRSNIYNKKLKKIFISIFIVFLVISSIRRLYLNYKYWGYFTLDNSQNKQWIDMQIWSKNNTSINAVFLIPVNLYGFRVYSQRAIVGSFKDGASMLFHPYLYKEWAKRMDDLGVKKEMAKGAFLFGYKEINNVEEIHRLAKKYGADYLVSGYSNLNLNKVYSNDKFSLYDLKNL